MEILKVKKSLKDIKPEFVTKEVALGDYVMIKDSCSNGHTYVKYAVANHCIAKVVSFESGAARLSFDRNVLAGKFDWYIGNNEVDILTPETGEALAKFQIENLAKIIKRNNASFKAGLKTKHVALADRKDYERVSTRLATNSNYLFIKAKAFDANFDCALSSMTKYIHAACCSVSKIDSDISVIIPKNWLNYFGYNLRDLKAWLNFIKECGIGFDYKIAGTVVLSEILGEANTKGTGGLVNEYDPKKEPNGRFYIDEKDKGYRINFKTGNHKMVTYLYFILVRYIYNNSYYSIPWVAMKLKSKLDCSNWEALLLAHLNDDYNYYYALFGATIVNSNMAHPTDPRNSAETILQRLRSDSHGMNTSFTMVGRDFTKIREAIRNEDYDVLQKFLNEYKDGKSGN